jgi:hypothetical protein
LAFNVRKEEDRRVGAEKERKRRREWRGGGIY